VAQLKHTVLLMPNGVNLVTGIPFELDSYVSEHSIAQAELKVSRTILILPLAEVLIIVLSRNWLRSHWDPSKVRARARRRLAATPLLLRRQKWNRRRPLRPRHKTTAMGIPHNKTKKNKSNHAPLKQQQCEQ